MNNGGQALVTGQFRHSREIIPHRDAAVAHHHLGTPGDLHSRHTASE